VDSIGGMPVIRILGSGDRSTTWLAQAPDGLVAVKVLEAQRDPVEVFEEASVLWAARGPHVVRVERGVTDEQGHVALALEPVLHPVPNALTVSQAATLLVPILQEFGRLHRLRIIHGGRLAESVLLDQTGRPVLIGFGRGKVDATGAEIADERRRLADWAGLMLSGTRARSATESAVLEDLLRALEAVDPAAEWMEGFARWILSRLDPTPLPIGQVSSSFTECDHAALRPRQSAEARAIPGAGADPRTSLTGWLARLRRMIGEVRRGYLIAGAAALVCGVLAVALAVAPEPGDIGDEVAIDHIPSVDEPDPAREAPAPSAGPRSSLPTETMPPNAPSALGMSPAAPVRETATAAATRLAGIRDAVLIDVIGDAAIVEGVAGDDAAVRVLLVEGPDGWRISSSAEVDQ